MKTNIYVLVFGAIIAILVIAALSTSVFNKSLSTTTIPVNSTSYETLSNLQNYGAAPNVQGISAWINSPPLSIPDLRGKVVLVDFWTYSCINCIRTIPFLETLQKEYGNDGLVIIGVSTPEFGFEHNLSNVEAAVKQFNITYPVALDNNYSTWDAYGNEYWPADYLIDKNGDVRYFSFGEGPDDFNQTQQVVRELLENANYTLPSSYVNVSDALNFSQELSPEMYLGYSEVTNGRPDDYAGGGNLTPNENVTYTAQAVTTNDTIYLAGTWYNAPYDIVAVNGSELFLTYRAKSVNIVASGGGGNASIVVRLDGKNLSQGYLGADDHVVGGEAIASISRSRLYNIVSAPAYGWHTLEIIASKGFSIYTFTFG